MPLCPPRVEARVHLPDMRMRANDPERIPVEPSHRGGSLPAERRSMEGSSWRMSRLLSKTCFDVYHTVRKEIYKSVSTIQLPCQRKIKAVLALLNSSCCKSVLKFLFIFCMKNDRGGGCAESKIMQLLCKVCA